MKSEYTAKFRMVDEMSAAMVRLGDTGVNAIVDVEKSSVRLDSALLNTSKSSAEAAASLLSFPAIQRGPLRRQDY